MEADSEIPIDLDSEDEMEAEELGSDISSSESVDEEIKLNKNFIELLTKIDANKYSYDDYVLLVDIAHDLTDLDKIRQSSELFASVFPLSPGIWLRWLKVELAVASKEEDLQKVRVLFQRALADYYSVDIAKEYTNLAIRSKNSKEIWEEILPAYGYDYYQGGLIFEAWREDYKSKEPDSAEKFKKIVKKYKEELLLPLENTKKTYVEFRTFVDDHKELGIDLTAIESEYKQTRKILDKVAEFEKNILKLDPKYHQERVELYQKYIEKCGDDLDEENIQILYERMVASCCLSTTAWKDYLNYLQTRSKDWEPTSTNKSPIFQQTALVLIDRALRNCSWSDDMYIEKMRIFEKQKRAFTEIQDVLEAACLVSYKTAVPIVNIWLEYLSILSRATNYNDENSAELLRKNFNLAWNSLGKQWGDLADANCEILQFWGKLEYGLLKDPSKGKQLWNSVMESGDNYTRTGLWVEFAYLEKQKNIDGARHIFKRAMSQNDLNDPTSLIFCWTQYERVHGNADQLKYCQEFCKKSLKYNRNFNAKSSNRRKDYPAAKDDSKKRKISDSEPVKNKKVKEHAVVSKDDFQKLSISPVSSSTQEREVVEIDKTKDNVRVFFSNLGYEVTEEDLQTAFPEIQIVKLDLIKTAGKSRGFGYAELGCVGDVPRALGMDRRMLAGRPVFISKCERDKSSRPQFRYSDDLEPNKLFVKGLHVETTKDDLIRLFEQHGKLKDVRVVCHKNGNSKGIAYIEFETESAAKVAVMKLDQYELHDHKINVAISAPPKFDDKKAGGRAQSSGFAGFAGTRKLFPKGEQKSRISFVPASVQKAVSAKQTDPNAAPKSNEDFRKMLLK